MARGAAQFAAIHARHDQLRRMDRGEAVDIARETGIKKGANWVLAEGADGAHMARSLPLEKCLDDCLVVYGQNGEALRPEQGYPLRLVVPGWQGNVNIKWLRRLELGDQPWFTREETSKYTELMPDGKARGFTWLDLREIGDHLPLSRKAGERPGLYEIARSCLERPRPHQAVDVSFDGGVNWHSARLQEPVLPKALTRFTMPWRWDGQPALLQSRAVDETGLCSRPSRNCAQCAAPMRSITTIPSRPGRSNRMGACSMSSSVRPLPHFAGFSLCAGMTALAMVLLSSLTADAAGPGYFGYGKPATPARSPAGISTCAPDGVGLPAGKGTVNHGATCLRKPARPATARSARARAAIRTDGRRRHADRRPAGAERRQLLALCDHAVRLYQPRDAVSGAALAVRRRRLCHHRLCAEPQQLVPSTLSPIGTACPR